MNEGLLSRRGWLERIASGSTAFPEQAAVPGPPSSARAAGPGQPKVPRTELVNVLEFETEARLALPPAAFNAIAGSDRSQFDRVTIHPRLMIPTTGLDLTAKFFGVDHLAPILVGPVADQKRFHTDGAVATAQGASAAQATIVASSRMGSPIEAVVAATKFAPWFQVFDADPAAGDQIRQAVAAGSKVIVVTTGAAVAANNTITFAAPDWPRVGRLVKAAGVPVVVKGVRSATDAESALAQGAAGVVASEYPAMPGSSRNPMTVGLFGLSAVADRVKGRVPIFADGNFRRGTDIIKALALGASGVFVSRPAMWGLAAYGPDGVQGIVEMLQTELARYMAMSGRPTLASLDRTLVKIHDR